MIAVFISIYESIGWRIYHIDQDPEEFQELKKQMERLATILEKKEEIIIYYEMTLEYMFIFLL
jgi:hypothetical protein